MINKITAQKKKVNGKVREAAPGYTKKSSKTPPLRFRGFDGVWEEKKLGEVCNFWNGKAHEQDISETGYIVVNSKFISSNGDVKKFSNRQISPLSKGDICIVMSDVPNGKALAKCFLVDKDDTYTLNQRIGGIKSEKIISDFLYRVLDRKKYFLKFDNKVTQTNLRKDEILKCPLKFPSKPEQEKIAGFLSAVDEWLENLKEQKRSYERYKKGLMQKLFPVSANASAGRPVKGQPTPAIRFNGFSGDWEEKKLWEVFDNIGGTSLEKYVSPKGDYKFISIGNYSKDGKYIDNGQRILLSEKTKTKLLNKDDLAMVLNDKTKTGDIIGSTILIDDNNYIYNQRTERLICKNIILPKYAWFYLNSNNFRKSIFKISQGGTQIYVNFPAVKQLKIKLPSLAEQEKITMLLSSIDDIIKKTEIKITQAEQWKKGLMQRLFV